MTLASNAATGLAVAGIHSMMLLRDQQNLFHRRALAIALAVGGVTAVLLPLSGDILAKATPRDQPAKFAFLEVSSRSAVYKSKTDLELVDLASSAARVLRIHPHPDVLLGLSLHVIL